MSDPLHGFWGITIVLGVLWCLREVFKRDDK